MLSIWFHNRKGFNGNTYPCCTGSFCWDGLNMLFWVIATAETLRTAREVGYLMPLDSLAILSLHTYFELCLLGD